MTGWVKLHRKIVEWEWYQDTNTRSVFFHLILTANHEDKNWRGSVIKRGQRLCGLRQIADELNMSVQNVRTALKHLCLTSEITDTASNKGRLITVTNYDWYQEDNRQANKQLTSNQQAANKQLTTTKECKNEKNYKKERETQKKTSAPRASRLAPDWHVSEEDERWAEGQGLSKQQIFSEAEKFRDYWHSQPGQKGVKLDWSATWRNWIRRSYENAAARKNHKPSKAEGIHEMFNQLRAQYGAD